MPNLCPGAGHNWLFSVVTDMLCWLGGMQICTMFREFCSFTATWFWWRLALLTGQRHIVQYSLSASFVKTSTSAKDELYRLYVGRTVSCFPRMWNSQRLHPTILSSIGGWSMFLCALCRHVPTSQVHSNKTFLRQRLARRLFWCTRTGLWSCSP